MAALEFSNGRRWSYLRRRLAELDLDMLNGYNALGTDIDTIEARADVLAQLGLWLAIEVEQLQKERAQLRGDLAALRLQVWYLQRRKRKGKARKRVRKPKKLLGCPLRHVRDALCRARSWLSQTFS